MNENKLQAVKPLRENVIALDMAELEFKRFIDTMDLDVDVSKMDDDDRAGFEKQKGRIINAICCGSLIVNDNGEPVFTPQKSTRTESLTFHEPTGASLMSMDGKKKNHDVAKLYSVMSDMTKTNANVFSKLALRDLNVCTAVTTLFLG